MPARPRRSLRMTDTRSEQPADPLTRVVGGLAEVPVMLFVCSFCNRTRYLFPVQTGA